MAASRVVCAESEAGAALKTGAAASSAGGVLEGETPVETRWTYWDATPPLSEKPPAAPRNTIAMLERLPSDVGGMVYDSLSLLELAALADAQPTQRAKIEALEERWLRGCFELCGGSLA